MSETTGSHQVEARHLLAQSELPSLSLITSLPKFNKSTGEWHGKIKLHRQIVTVVISLFGGSKFPVYGEIDARLGAGHENWKFVETADSLDFKLVTANPSTILAPDITEPEDHPSGVGIDLVFKKVHSRPQQPRTIDDINFKRSTVSGREHSVRKVAQEFVEIATALRQVAR